MTLISAAVVIHAARAQPTEEPARVEAHAEVGPRWQGVDFSEFASVLRRDYPDILDPLTRVPWPSGVHGAATSVRLGRSIGMRSSWRQEALATMPTTVEASARGDDAGPLTFATPANSSIHVRVAWGPRLPERIPSFALLPLAGERRPDWRPTREEMRGWSPLRFFEFVIDRRQGIRPDATEDAKAEAVPLLFQFGRTRRVSVRLESQVMVGFVAFNPAGRPRTGAGPRETAWAAIFDRSSGAFVCMLTVVFHPSQMEGESIQSVMNVILSGVDPKLTP